MRKLFAVLIVLLWVSPVFAADTALNGFTNITESSLTSSDELVVWNSGGVKNITVENLWDYFEATDLSAAIAAWMLTGHAMVLDYAAGFDPSATDYKFGYDSTSNTLRMGDEDGASYKTWYPGPASPTSDYLVKWGTNQLVDGPKVGTMTDAKWCKYTTSGGLACTENEPTGGSSTKNIVLSATPHDGTLYTGNSQACVSVPVEFNGMNLTSVGAHVYTASSSGTPTFQVSRKKISDNSVADMLSTLLTIDINERDTSTAATAPVINTTYDDVSTGDELCLDVDVAGTGTKGGEVRLGFILP